VALASSLWPLHAVEAASLAGDPTVEIEKDVQYGTADGVPLLMDVYGPAGRRGPLPAIVVVHGGGFYSGDKSDPSVTRVSHAFAALGYRVFNVNYRLAPEYPFPAANDDVQHAIGYIRQNARSLGVDPKRIGILGSSAGSTLAAWVAYVGKGPLDVGSRVSAVVTFSGAFDLPALPSELPPGDPRVNPDMPGHGYLVPGADLNEQATAASPITYVDPSDPPILMIRSQDESSPLEQSELMLSKLKAAGVPSQLIVRPGTAHALSGPGLAKQLYRSATFFDGRLDHDGVGFLIAERADPFDHRSIALALILVLGLGVVAALLTRSDGRRDTVTAEPSSPTASTR
jgi:acetyl esterase/lipase